MNREQLGKLALEIERNEYEDVFRNWQFEREILIIDHVAGKARTDEATAGGFLLRLI